jgi:hypothetical protein
MLVSRVRLIILEFTFPPLRFGAHFLAGIVQQYCRLLPVQVPLWAHLSNLIVYQRQVQYSAFIEKSAMSAVHACHAFVTVKALFRT